jgi:uncharacterized protein (DUF1810 family)
MTAIDTVHHEQSLNLSRFETAQEKIYEQALSELQSGQKRTHWMWFIFPQIAGLGLSSTSVFYAIKSKDEAVAYLNHPILGPRLLQCTETILAIDGRSASQIFGTTDDKKLKSSMTLFARLSTKNSPFHRVLHKYFNDNIDDKTLCLLEADAED